MRQIETLCTVITAEVLKESVESFFEIYKHPFQCIL
jgi:hypothetical protein